MHDTDSRRTRRKLPAGLPRHWQFVLGVTFSIALLAWGVFALLRSRNPLDRLFDAEHENGTRSSLGRVHGERYGTVKPDGSNHRGSESAVPLAVHAAAVNVLLRFSERADLESLHGSAIANLANA